MNKFYESPEVEIEWFDLINGKVFTITESNEGGFESGDTEEEW